MYRPQHGMAQLPPSALLLDGVHEGSVARAAEQLRLAQPTVSGQIRALEQALGEKLFTRSGRHLVPTDVGRIVYRYADEISRSVAS